MHFTKIKILVTLIALCIISCNEEKNEDVTNTVNRNGSVETAVNINHIDSSFDELITTHTIWVKGQQYKTVEYRDTLPSLGVGHTVAENAEGDEKDVVVKKDYEIFITVK